VKILDAVGKVKHTVTTGKDGMYTIDNLSAGTYTMVVANVQKVSLVVKSGSNNTVVNAMIPAVTEPYTAGAGGGLSAPLIVAIAGGVLLVGFAAWKIADFNSDKYEVKSDEPVSP
jgi:hypothetical protein